MQEIEVKHREQDGPGMRVPGGPLTAPMHPGLFGTDVRRRGAAPGAQRAEAEHPAPERGIEQNVRDDVDGASEDSFPASDPPSWIGVRIGGPPRGPVEVPHSAPRISDGAPAVGAEPAGRAFDSQWIAGQWSRVHVCSADVVERLPQGTGQRATLRAVVQLGALTPADVVVTARSVVPDFERASIETMRLWSVQSHHNGAFVFEAAAADARAIDEAADFLVTVEPAPTRPRGRVVASAARLVTPSRPDGCTTCTRT